MQLIYSRSIDKSLLWDGFSIQSCFLNIVTEITGTLGIGERKNITFLLNHKLYDGIVLKNLPFNRSKYPNHKEIYQVRYSPSSSFSNALRVIFSDVWDYINVNQKIQKEVVRRGETRRNIKIPHELQRKVAFFTTEMPDVWLVETYSANDFADLADSLQESTELITNKLIQIRKLSRKSTRLN